MSINRIRSWTATREMSPGCAPAVAVIDNTLRSGASQMVDEYLREHPGEQACLLILDSREEIVLDLLSRIYGAAAEQLAANWRQATAAACGERPTQALWVKVVSRAAGIETARFLAKHEECVQALLDQAMLPDAIAICLAEGRMLIGSIGHGESGADLGEAERARRQDRARRLGR